MRSKMIRLFGCAAIAGALSLFAVPTSGAVSGAIYTTDKTGTVVNANTQYGFSTDVYLSGGPQNLHDRGLSPDGTYYFQVTDPSGATLLSTDNAVCRQLTVSGGRVVGATGPCPHANGIFNPANGARPVQLAPFSATPNAGNEYKAWMIPTSKATIDADNIHLIFDRNDSKTDNFKVPAVAVPPGSCAPSSSLSVLVSGSNVTSYVPKGNWCCSTTTGVSVVNVEGSSIVPTLIPTANVVNSCASNATTGTTVCTANNTDVYLLSGMTLTSTLTSGGSGAICFSGGCATNTGVAMDAVHNKAVLGLSIASVPGFQFLNLATSAFEPAFTSPSGNISEDPLLDPLHNTAGATTGSRLLSPSEGGNYEIVDVTTTTSPAFFEKATGGGILDSAGEDCSTQIALAPAEFSGPSNVFIADITTPPAVFTAGAPGTWSAPSQVQTLSESFLSAGASGIAVAQGPTHTGVVSGEFGGDALTAIVLPATSGTGGVPAIGDWVTCEIGGGFFNAFDPHGVTAYQSPATGHAVAVLANFPATTLAVVDLTNMLNPAIVPRTGAGHGCATSPLPGTVVSFISVP